MTVKVSDLKVGDKFVAHKMCGPNYLYQRVADADTTGVTALNLDCGGKVRFQFGIDVSVIQ